MALLIGGAGCLSQTGSGEVSSRLELSLLFSDLNSPITSESDTIIVNSVKFLQDSIQLSGSTAQDLINDSTFVIEHGTFGNAVVNIASVELSPGIYSTILYKIKQAEQDDQEQAPEFVDGPGADERYSFIIRGQFNGNSFTYKVATDLRFVLGLGDDRNVPESGTVLGIGIEARGTDWFRSEQGGLLDPRNSENDSTINQNLKNSFTLPSP